MKFESATPYIASYVLLEEKGKLAFVLRAHTGWMEGFYGLPAGKVEKGETFSEAAIREAEEEVGVRINADSLEYVHTMHRKEQEDPNNNWVDVFFRAHKWSGTPHNAEPELHSELVWLDPDNLPDNVIPMIKLALSQIQDGHTYSEFGWG